MLYNTSTYPLTCQGTATPVPGYGSTPAPGSTLDAGSAQVGQATSTTLTVRETGTAQLDVANVTVTGANAADFSATPTSFSIADGGAARDITVSCTPAALGSRTATLTVYNNAPSTALRAGIAGTTLSTASYPLTCQGTATPAAGYDSTPAPGSTLNVGTAAVGATVTTPLVIREIGTATLNITNVTLSGTHAGDFSVQATTLSIPDGGAAQSLIVRCTPTAAGARTAALSVFHNASGSTATYPLTCTATAVTLKVFLPLIAVSRSDPARDRP